MAILQYKVSDTDSKYLTPSGGLGIVDVVNDFAWTKSPKSARKDVPYVFLTEFQQTTGQLGASMEYYSRIAGDFLQGDNPLAPKDPSSVYKYKYFANPTGFSYRLPFFSTQKHSRSTDFSGENGNNPFQSSTDLGKQILGYGTNRQSGNLFAKEFGYLGEISTLFGLSKAVANTIVTGNIDFEFPQKWAKTTENSLKVSFTLSNTGTVEDVINNRKLAHLLTHQNSSNRRNFALNDPVVIYSLECPDVVNFPACYVNSLNITNLGNTRLMTLEGKERIVPEAYQFDMEFVSLILPTRYIMQQMEEGKTVQVIGQDETVGVLQPFTPDSVNPNSSPSNLLSSRILTNNGIPQ